MPAFKRYADFIAKLRVPCGFLLAAIFAWRSQPTVHSLTAGLPISMAGLWLRGWAAGHVEKNMRLAQSGPYAYVRNPLYLGTALVAAGLVIASRGWLLAVIFTVVFLAVYLPVIELEEQHLRALFPEFAAYAERVPKLRPSVGLKSATLPFRWKLYWSNREYQAALGFLGGAGFLVAKMVFRPDT